MGAHGSLSLSLTEGPPPPPGMPPYLVGSFIAETAGCCVCPAYDECENDLNDRVEQGCRQLILAPL